MSCEIVFRFYMLSVKDFHHLPARQPCTGSCPQGSRGRAGARRWSENAIGRHTGGGGRCQKNVTVPGVGWQEGRRLRVSELAALRAQSDRGVWRRCGTGSRSGWWRRGWVQWRGGGEGRGLLPGFGTVILRLENVLRQRTATQIKPKMIRICTFEQIWVNS